MPRQQFQVDVTVALERRLTRFIERQKFGEGMGRCLTFLNAIAVYPSIQSHCEVLAVTGRLSPQIVNEVRRTRNISPKSREVVPAQTVDATLAWSLLAGVSKPKVFLGR